MNNKIYTPLQMREVFHLEFLRWFSRKLDAEHYCLKGGVNLRLFFGSIRYSEDMDLDIQGVRVERVKKTVMEILSVRGFSDSLKSFGIEKVVPPDIMKAKQTETTQRFKIHLLTSAGEDLFTKIEFSRRGMKGTSVVEPVPAQILRSYKMAPLLVSHYDTASAIQQKIQALAQRSILQARDIFDLFVLSSQYEGLQQKHFPRPAVLAAERRGGQVGKAILKTAYDNIFLVEFPQFRDTVVAYLGVEDQKAYSSPAAWDEIKLKTAHFLEEFKNGNAKFS
jgi:predicted nucleotidyltransferase component of viral defense system